MAGASAWPFFRDPIAHNASQQLVVPITFGPATTSGTSSATDATSLTDSGATFTAHALIGSTVYSNGSSGVITENTTTVITVTSWTGGTPTAVKPYMVGAAGIKGPMGTFTLGTVTGVVLVRMMLPVVTTTLTDVGGTGLLGIGTTTHHTQFMASGTAAALVSGVVWTSGSFAASAILVAAADKDVATSENITASITGENFLSGVMNFYIYWDPVSLGATVV